MASAPAALAYSVLRGTLPAQDRALVDLWREGGLTTTETEAAVARLSWFYLDNPQGAAQLNFLGFGESKISVGCLGVAPRHFFVGGEAVTGGTLIDFAVSPKHRSAYPALTLQRTGRERALRSWEFVYGLPDTKAVAICKRLATHVSFQLPRFVRVIRSRIFLARVLPGSLATALAWFVDSADSLITHARLSFARKRGEWLNDFDTRFDALWTAFEKKNTCIGLRDRTFLQWRFSAQPHHEYQTFGITRHGSDELLMYFVCQRSEHGLVVKDCLNIGSEADLRHGLLMLIAAARKLGASAIDLQLSADSTWNRALRHTHFYLRSQRPFFAAFREPLQQQAQGCHWYITQADEDI